MRALLAGGLTVLAVVMVAWRLRPSPHRLGALTADRTDEPAADHRPWLEHARRAVGRSATAASAARRRRVVLGGAAIVVVLALVAWPPAGIVLAVIVLLAPAWRRRRAAARHHALVRRHLPDTIDLLVVTIGAGLTPALALPRLAAVAPPVFADALAEVRSRTERGQRLADALDALPDRLGPPVRPLVSALVASERYGTPLAPTLDLLAHEARQERRRQAEEAARQLPVRLCFPLVCCTLPAFVLLTIAPLMAGALRSLHI